MTEQTASTNKKILATGFGSFGYLKKRNVSSEIALPSLEQEYGDLVKTLVLPVAFDIAAKQLCDAIEQINPAAVVMFGISAGKKVRLERQAKNRRLSVLFPDNYGVRKIGRIDEDGPKRISSTLPLDAIYSRLTESNVPTKFSNSAETFICNEVMYKALQKNGAENRREIIPTGFIHLGNGLSDQLVEEASLFVVDEVVKYSASVAE